jgi:predicted outer membrane lipoprotein
MPDKMLCVLVILAFSIVSAMAVEIVLLGRREN